MNALFRKTKVITVNILHVNICDISSEIEFLIYHWNLVLVSSVTNMLWVYPIVHGLMSLPPSKLDTRRCVSCRASGNRDFHNISYKDPGSP